MIGKPLSMKCLMAFLLLLNCTVLFAQERVITGKIKDPSGNPLPGVNVNVFGTRISVTADVTGTFRIPVSSENSVLVFSFVGFLQKEQKVGNDSALSILMTYDNADLDQVVVVGYGTSKRRDLTGSVYSIKPGMVTATPVTNAAEALQGRIPGLDINRTNGAPGGGVSIQLRGNRTLSGTNNGFTGTSSEPLVIIDGFQGGSLTDLNPNDIESVEVLKDASSTAIYGWMGANGVIIVTTKKGKDRPKVSYAGYYGVNGYVRYPKPRMGDQFIQFRKDAYMGGNPTAADPAVETLLDVNEKYYYALGDWVDWQKQVTQNGIEQSHTFSIQSGGDKTKVYFGTGVYNEQGIIKGTDNTRYSARLNYDQRISNMFKAGFSTQLTYTNTNQRSDPFSQISQMSPLGQVYDSAGNIRLWPGVSPINYTDPGKNGLSPITDERPNAYKWNTARGNIIANGYLEVTPLTGLSVRTNFGTTLTYSREGRYFDSISLNNYSNQHTFGSTAQVINNFARFYNWDNIITYTRKFGDHALTLTGLTSYTRSDVDGTDITGYKLTNTNFKFYALEGTNAGNRLTKSSYQRYNTFSYAGRLNYTLMGKYLFNATIRADGVSRLSPGKQWDYFPSVGLGWNIHQEEFMKDFYFINNLKLRGTYGVAGNASVTPYGTQTVLATNSYIIGAGPLPVAFPTDQPGNNNLKWEKSSTYNVGLDFALFKSHLYGTIDAYKTNTTDILYRRPLPLSSGEATQWQNIGTSENKGIEVALSSVNVNSHAFKWTTTATFTMAREKLTKLATNKDVLASETNSLLIGHPVNSFYGYKKVGIWQTDENKDKVHFGTYEYKPGDIKVLDRNTDGEIDNVNDQGYDGSTVPKWFGGLQNNFSYKNFELSVYVVARWGQTINAEMMAGRFNVTGAGNGLADWNYWTPTNPTNDFPQPRSNQNFSSPGYTGYLSALNFVDGSYVKLKTATLAYTLPGNISRKVYSDKIRLYVTGNNIFTQTKNKLLKNYDPERGGSENTPITRQFVFGANVDF
jgi:TonB-linked SusC/RagA family outer membrane protein